MLQVNKSMTRVGGVTEDWSGQADVGFANAAPYRTRIRPYVAPPRANMTEALIKKFPGRKETIDRMPDS